MSSSTYNRNPTGRNQHPALPPASDETLARLLRRYHASNISSNKRIQKLLEADMPGLTFSIGTIKNRRKDLGLRSSRQPDPSMTETEKIQLVLQAMDDDPTSGHGKGTVHARIAFNSGVHLPRQFVSDVMHVFDPEGFIQRSPNQKKVYRVRNNPVGIHERWAGDGHDKLCTIGFGVWAIVDYATGKWLGAWVVPNNRLGRTVAYLFLCVVEKYGGMPLQMSLDCGSETTQVFGLANALRERYQPDIPIEELAAVSYVRSVHNISIERSWLRLRIEWGNNAVEVFHDAISSGIYNPDNEDQYLLVKWLYSKMLQETLDSFMRFRNGARMRKDKDKAGPSGCSRDEAFSCYREWGGKDCLQPVDVNVVRVLKEYLGGEDNLRFVPVEFAARVQASYNSLGVTELTCTNVWHVFQDLFPLVFPEF